jgi:hypothetical protein
MENEQKNMELVTVADVNNLYEASMLKDVLEAAGITVFLQNEMSEQLYNVGGVLIQVPDTEAEKARQLLVEGGHV